MKKDVRKEREKRKKRRNEEKGERKVPDKKKQDSANYAHACNTEKAADSPVSEAPISKESSEAEIQAPADAGAVIKDISGIESDTGSRNTAIIDRHHPVTACYVDFENVFFTMRASNKVPGVTRLVRTLNRMSREIAGEGFYKTGVYANWDHVIPESRHAQNDWSLVGWKTLSIPTREDYWSGNPIKNLVDFVMSLDILEDAFSSDIDIFFIVSGDSDFVEVVERLKRKRKKVIVISLKPNLSFRLREAADECHVLTFDELEGAEPLPYDSYRTGRALPRQKGERAPGKAAEDEFQILCRCIERAEKEQGFKPMSWKVVRDEYFLNEVHTSPEEADRFISQLAESGFLVLKKQVVKGKGIYTMISLPDRR